MLSGRVNATAGWQKGRDLGGCFPFVLHVTCWGPPTQHPLQSRAAPALTLSTLASLPPIPTGQKSPLPTLLPWAPTRPAHTLPAQTGPPKRNGTLPVQCPSCLVSCPLASSSWGAFCFLCQVLHQSDSPASQISGSGCFWTITYEALRHSNAGFAWLTPILHVVHLGHKFHFETSQGFSLV